jgi:hypothetical protein
MADNVTGNPGAGGDVIAADDVGGVKLQRVKLVLGADGVNAGDVAAGNPIPAILSAASPATTVIGTVQGGTLTKGTQGSTGFTTQALKDSGRVIVNASTAIAGVACVAVEALVALDVSRGAAATASETTHAVTANKIWRLQSLVIGIRSTAAAVLAGRFSLRYNATGACTATDPIIAEISLSSGDALVQAGREIVVPLPDCVEFSGTQQWGLTQVCNVNTGQLYASVIGFEY